MTPKLRLALAFVVGCALGGCGKKDAPSASTTTAASTTTTSAVIADGKYEHVKVEGVEVPMVNVMNGGTVVLVDTDGVKPRSWEEQYKRKGDKMKDGSFNIHKTNVNKDDGFDDDAIDREGNWTIDAKGNITKE